MAERNPEIAIQERESKALPLFEQAQARHSDPVHSHKAAASVENIGPARNRIKQILKKFGPLTDEQLIARWPIHCVEMPPFPYSDSGLRSRRNDLVQWGDVEAHPTIGGYSKAGRHCSVWRIAEGGESEIEQARRTR